MTAGRDSYHTLMKLWDEYQAGIEDHECVKEEFTTCEICERSWEAHAKLNNRLRDIFDLLERYHKALADLTRNVVQEVPLPREVHLQDAMLNALDVLERESGQKVM